MQQTNHRALQLNSVAIPVPEVSDSSTLDLTNTQAAVAPVSHRIRPTRSSFARRVFSSSTSLDCAVGALLPSPGTAMSSLGMPCI